MPSSAPQDAATAELLEHLRSEALPKTEAGQLLDLYVTGTLAAGVDISAYLASIFGTEGGPIEPYIPMLLFDDGRRRRRT